MSLIEDVRDAASRGSYLLPELVVACAILAASIAGWLPLGGTPFLIVLAVGSFWARRQGARGAGLDRRPHAFRMALLGLVAGTVYQLVSLYALEPLTARVAGALPDVSVFRPLEGDPRRLAIYLAVAWTVAGFGEELVYRGYFLNRFASAFGDSRRAQLAALVVSSALFGAGHLYQGASGVIDTGLAGVVLGGLYLWAGRNLWVPICAHGAMDTCGFLLIYARMYPGMH